MLSFLIDNLAYLFLAQGIVGILLFEVAYANTRRQRQIVEERDREFPQWRRRDVHLWTRAKFYPGAFCVMLPRMGLMICYWIILAIFFMVVFTGHDKSKPVTGWRHRVLMIANPFCVHIFFFCYGHYITAKNWKWDQVDYSKYLGPDKVQNQFKGKRVSTICGNHTNLLDHYTTLWNPEANYFAPRFTPGKICVKMPFIGWFIKCMQGYFIDKADTQEEKDKLVEDIGKEQKRIENADENIPPLCIFPEGTCNNGLYLAKFRRGPFTSECAIQPYITNYEWSLVNLGYDCMLAKDNIIMALSQFSMHRVTIDWYPPFQPNEYLFTEYRKQIPDGHKLERWEVYAHAVRDLMAEIGGLGMSDQSMRDKFNYQKYMLRLTDSVTLSEPSRQKTFYYPYDAKKSGDLTDFKNMHIIRETNRLTKYDVQNRN